MAPPKSPWNKIAAPATPKAKKNGSTSAAKQQQSGSALDGSPSTPAAATYAQAQDDEIEALKAIYMEDYEPVETKGAWSKATERAFKLSLKAYSDPETLVVLSVRLTTTYPKSVPLLSVEKTAGLRPKHLKEVEKIIKTRPKELLGEVMIYEISIAIQDVLEDAVAARQQDDAMPSLEEERAVHEAAAEQLSKKQEEEESKKREEEKAEEDRMLKQMVDEEMSRRKEHKRKNRVFFAPAKTMLPEIETQPMALIREGPVTQVFSVQAALSPEYSVNLLVLKKAVVKNQKNEARLKKLIEDFDQTMEDLKRISHDNVISMLDFKIDRVANGDWHISILLEYADKGSLSEMFSVVESFPANKVRAWTVELLEALDYLHRNGVVHKRVHSGNVLLCQPASSGAIFVKLADGGFQESLHTITDVSRGTAKVAPARSAYWQPPEMGQDCGGKSTRKTDIWDLGIVFLQMLFGLDTPQKYSSPNALAEDLELSEPLKEIVEKFFKPDPKKRPSAFDLIPSEFLRGNAPTLLGSASPERSASLSIRSRGRMRRESSNYASGSFHDRPFSRYASEWVEAGRLGKGGYGEVVKARNKLDGRIYAIKKIRQKSAAALTEVLSEVMLLSRLNHPYVVRYYTAWPEHEETDPMDTETEDDTVTFTEDSASSSGQDFEFGRSNTGGLDFISSSGYPKIEFGDVSDEESVSDNDESSSNGEESHYGIAASRSPLKMRRDTSSFKSRAVRTTLYIQMEYCERHTLRDLIRKGLYDNPDEAWRLFRQILEGLAHIHSHGIIHRDLKPDNVFIDVTNNPRIGDFGLATSGQYQVADKTAAAGSATGSNDADMTRSVGTALYVAPELRSGAGGSYNDKVDMYSLGVIFFEMCHPLKTAMERDHVIRELREKEHALPPTFQNPTKALQGSIILTLISHRPSERPSSTELLRSGKLPLQVEDETVRLALQGLSDPNSPYYHKMLSALFAQGANKQIKDFAWDLGQSSAHEEKASDVVLQCLVEEKLSNVFRRHGAVKTRRQLLFPKSAHYENQNVVQLFDASGTLVQLPYDFTLPFARTLARRKPPADKTYSIGHVYRDTFTGGAPRSSGEADFDIISYNSLDLALKEAEVIKVMDEVLDELPSLASSQVCFHLNHSDLLELIMESCRIAPSLRRSVKDILSRLNIQQWSWQKIKQDLRSPAVGVSSTSLDDLAKFDFRDTPEKTFAKIKSLLSGTELLDRTHAIFAHLRQVLTYLGKFNVQRKIYCAPLSSFNSKFYSGGIMFQCLFDTKRRDVLAAGGRYDRLIEEHKPKFQGEFTGCHAVGMNIGWDRLVTSMARHHKSHSKVFLKKAQEEENGSNQWPTRRCDVLVASFDATTLRSAGTKIVSDLWAHEISSELSTDCRDWDELIRTYAEDKHSWIVIIKHEALNTGKPDIKIKSISKKEDTDLRSSELLSYLRQELRERDHREGLVENRTRMSRLSSDQPNYGNHGAQQDRKGNVQVLLAQHRSKKTNKWAVVEASRTSVHELLAGFQENPIAAIETKDEILDMLRDTRLSDADSWRRVIQSVPLVERSYLQEVMDMLREYRRKWEEEGSSPEGRVAFLYNFRTGACVMYDLGL
ncbi:kinase-like protein [Phyllosticta citribraziliensis]|uniref:non-specific serine/threonine protein kinase n=1 Tax=Phyllosticta citribraziliensis TaxID=989973 RepID=A0ABR1LBR3_9PEZI